LTLGIKAEIEKNKNKIQSAPSTNKCWTLTALYWPQGWKKDTIKFGRPICNPRGQCSIIYWYPDVNVLAY
jgi:hypothetical protein